MKVHTVLGALFGLQIIIIYLEMITGLVIWQSTSQLVPVHVFMQPIAASLSSLDLHSVDMETW
jgi:hypothetical protein